MAKANLFDTITTRIPIAIGVRSYRFIEMDFRSGLKFEFNKGDLVDGATRFPHQRFTGFLVSSWMLIMFGNQNGQLAMEHWS